MNALILHARWAGLVQQRGMAVLAVLGNIIVIWSWFGVNMLGVGLHSYGFIPSTFWAMVGADIAHFGIAFVGMIPMRFWRSYCRTARARAAAARSFAASSPGPPRQAAPRSWQHGD